MAKGGVKIKFWNDFDKVRKIYFATFLSLLLVYVIFTRFLIWGFGFDWIEIAIVIIFNALSIIIPFNISYFLMNNLLIRPSSWSKMLAASTIPLYPLLLLLFGIMGFIFWCSKELCDNDGVIGYFWLPQLLAGLIGIIILLVYFIVRITKKHP